MRTRTEMQKRIHALATEPQRAALGAMIAAAYAKGAADQASSDGRGVNTEWLPGPGPDARAALDRMLAEAREQAVVACLMEGNEGNMAHALTAARQEGAERERAEMAAFVDSCVRDECSPAFIAARIRARGGRQP